jgi:hypothetical protein
MPANDFRDAEYILAMRDGRERCPANGYRIEPPSYYDMMGRTSAPDNLRRGDTHGDNRDSELWQNPDQGLYFPGTSELYGKLSGGRSHIHERKDRRTGTQTHQSGDRTVATTVTPEVFCLDKLKVCRLSPLQSLCVVDKDCNVTGVTDNFLTDELSLPSPISNQSIPIIQGKICLLAILTI